MRRKLLTNRIYPYALLLVSLLLIDCSCFSKPVVIRNVVLEVPVDNTALTPLDHNKFALVVEEAINKNSDYRYDPQDSDGATLRFSLVPPDKKTSDTVMMLVATLHKIPGGEYRSFADIKVIEGSVSGQDVLQGINNLLQNLYLIQKGSRADNQLYLDKIHAYLTGASVPHGELINAISVLGETREHKAAEPLIRLLSGTKDIVLGNACLIALSRLAAPEAMQAIIDFVELKPPLIRRQGIMAARVIASKLAAEWLLVMAYGHDDPLVRQEALEALIEVEKKLSK